jgi:hypothetical protein
MNVSSITMPSHWGREVRHKYIARGSKVLAVIFPGKNYSAERPLLEYAAKVAAEHNCDILKLEYGYQSARVELKRDDMGIIIEECTAAITSVPKYEKLLFISKSMGSVIAGEIAASLKGRQQIEHLYLTPIPDALPLIGQSQGSVIYGGADPMFSEQHSRELAGLRNIKIFRIDDANHSLEVGNVKESVAILIFIINLYHEFFQRCLKG